MLVFLTVLPKLCRMKEAYTLLQLPAVARTELQRTLSKVYKEDTEDAARNAKACVCLSVFP